MRTGSYAPSAYVIKVTQTFICKCVIFLPLFVTGLLLTKEASYFV